MIGTRQQQFFSQPLLLSFLLVGGLGLSACGGGGSSSTPTNIGGPAIVEFTVPSTSFQIAQNLEAAICVFVTPDEAFDFLDAYDQFLDDPASSDLDCSNFFPLQPGARVELQTDIVGFARLVCIVFAPDSPEIAPLLVDEAEGRLSPGLNSLDINCLVPEEGDLDLNFTTDNYVVNEGDGTAVIQVARIFGPATESTVDFETLDGTAIAGTDYTATLGTLTFPSFDPDGGSNVLFQTFEVPIRDDNDVEGDETVQLILSNPTGGAELGPQSTATLTILDNDDFGEFSFGSSPVGDPPTYTTQEGSGTATINVVRDGSGGAVSVDFDVDFGGESGISGTLNFAPGETTQPIVVPVPDNGTVDCPPALEFDLSLSNPQGGATLGSPSDATLIIEDDDGPPQFGEFDFGNFDVSGDTVFVNVERNTGSDCDVSVTVTATPSTVPASSVSPTSTTLSFPSGDIAETGTFDLTLPTGCVSGTIDFTLSDPQGGATLPDPPPTLQVPIDTCPVIP